jgi:hypothetical protein
MKPGSGRKLSLAPTQKLAGEGFKRQWPPLSKMNEAVEGIVADFANSH